MQSNMQKNMQKSMKNTSSRQSNKGTFCALGLAGIETMLSFASANYTKVVKSYAVRNANNMYNKHNMQKNMHTNVQTNLLKCAKMLK